MRTLSIIIPALNEEEGIEKVIDAVPKRKLMDMGYKTEIIVVDNGSTDKTKEIAKKGGARVIIQPIRGKGRAVLKGFDSLNGRNPNDVVAMIDADNTYNPKEIPKLVKKIKFHDYDVVIGSRLSGNIKKGSMSTFNFLGNKLFTYLVKIGYNKRVDDVCTGMFVWKKGVVDELKKHIKCDGFSLEMDMITKMSKMGYSIISVPITYRRRLGQAKLHPFKDGGKILRTYIRNLSWK